MTLYGKTYLLGGMAALAGTALLPATAWAQTGRIEGFGGIARDERPIGPAEDKFSGGVLPSIAFDLGQAALQLDGMAADHRGDTVLAAAVHLGVKASDALSIGGYAAYANHDTLGGLESYRVGAEAVYRAPGVVLAGIAGYEHTEQRVAAAGTVPGFFVIDSYGKGGQFFSIADITVYPDPDLSLTGGHRYIGGRHAAAAGVEKAFSIGGASASLFAEGRIGERDYKAAWVGLRIRFGKGGKTLEARDREEGYANRLKDELFTYGNSRRRNLVEIPPPPPIDDDDDGCSVCGPCYAV